MDQTEEKTQKGCRVMKDMDLIQALRRMAPETGSLHCLGCGYENRCSLNGCAIIRQAVERLKELPAQPPNDPLTQRALGAVVAERKRQDTLWGDQSGNSLFEWVSILGEEYGELCEAVNETSFSNATHPDRGGFEAIIKEAVQVAAVAVAITEAAYRRKPEEGQEN